MFVFLIDKILKTFDEGFLTRIISVNLQKVFDTIDHKTLLKKLKSIRFLIWTIQWLRFCLSERIFLANTDSKLSDFGQNSYVLPQGSILCPIFFLIFMNDKPQAYKSTVLLYADDSCILYQHKKVDETEKRLNKDFENICGLFVDNKLSIYFGEDKTKSILFASKRRAKNVCLLNIRYKHMNIKQHS